MTPLALVTGLPLVAALAWTVALIADSEPFGAVGALLIGVGILTMSTVSVVGVTIAGGRWAHRLAVASAAAGLVIAAIRPIDGFWVAGLVASTAAGSAMFIPQVTSRVRKLPAAGGPPQAAVVAPLVLLGAPFLIGIASNQPPAWPTLTIGLSAPLVAFVFARVIPGGLMALRLLWPLLAIALAPMLGMPAAVVSAALGALVALLAWRPEVKAAFHPPREEGSAYPIPPELAPEDVLDAAHIDDRGRPK